MLAVVVAIALTSNNLGVFAQATVLEASLEATELMIGQSHGINLEQTQRKVQGRQNINDDQCIPLPDNEDVGGRVQRQKNEEDKMRNNNRNNRNNKNKDRNKKNKNDVDQTETPGTSETAARTQSTGAARTKPTKDIPDNRLVQTESSATPESPPRTTSPPDESEDNAGKMMMRGGNRRYLNTYLTVVEEATQYETIDQDVDSTRKTQVSADDDDEGKMMGLGRGMMNTKDSDRKNVRKNQQNRKKNDQKKRVKNEVEVSSCKMVVNVQLSNCS